jgi:hypothetical protein
LNRLTVEPWTHKYQQMSNEIKLEEIKIFGINKQPTRILWNGQDLTPTSKWVFDATKNILHMKMLTLNMDKIHKLILL